MLWYVQVHESFDDFLTITTGGGPIHTLRFAVIHVPFRLFPHCRMVHSLLLAPIKTANVAFHSCSVSTCRYIPFPPLVLTKLTEMVLQLCTCLSCLLLVVSILQNASWYSIFDAHTHTRKQNNSLPAQSKGWVCCLLLLFTALLLSLAYTWTTCGCLNGVHAAND